MPPKFDPKTRRLRREPKNKNAYRIVAIGLYGDQAASVDAAAGKLQEAGYLKANRSLIFQALVRRLQQDTEGMSAEQIFDYFLQQHMRRPLSSAVPRDLAESPRLASKARHQVRRA